MKIGICPGGATPEKGKTRPLRYVFTGKNVSRKNAVQQKNIKNDGAFSTKLIARMARTILGTL